MVRRSTYAMLLLALALGATGARAEDPPAGDPALGEKVFNKCRACHMIGEGAENAVGPELNGVIGRHSGSVPDYNYSEANKKSGLTWDEATFREYIRDPKAKVPGTKMSFAGLTKESDINNIVAYLKSFDASGKRKQP